MPEANLIQDKNQPALWVNDDWQQGSPGVFAVIIGVSDYISLPSPDTVSTDTYGMTKLAVSALTALHIFEWLRQDYFLPECPIAKIWLLLSPTLAEQDHKSWRYVGDKAPATFDNCRSALRSWQADVVSTGANPKSRAYFFFSGHGVQLIRNKHVLLASDWLREGAVSEGICTQNLETSLSISPMQTQMFMIDACRGCPRALRTRKIEGIRILDEDLACLDENSFGSMHMLYATSVNQNAWQPRSPADGISLFGKALSDGLRGTHPMKLNPHSIGHAVHVSPLHEYVAKRVHELLGQPGSQLDRQTVTLYGNRSGEDPSVTIIPPLQS